MNPVKNWLLSLSNTSFNVFVAVLFFFITAKVTSPAFFGKVAIVQLLEAFTGTALYFVPNQIVTREIAYAYAGKTLDRGLMQDFLTIPFLTLPFLLTLLAFPDYLRLTILYLFLYIAYSTESSEMVGMDMFKENAISGFIFSMMRWGVSLVAVLQRDIYLFLTIWTLGAILSNIFNLSVMSRRLGIKVLYPSFNLPFLIGLFRKELPLYLSNSLTFLSSQGDRIMTSYLLGSYYLGLYQFSALVGGVPFLLSNSVVQPLLSASSYYRAQGKDEIFMSSLTFRFVSFASLTIVIVSLPLVRLLIPILFPAYTGAVNILIILLMVNVLSFPINVLTNFIITFKRSLRPFFFITLVTAVTVILTSYLLIPNLGVLGGAISQLISMLITSVSILYYSVYTKVFSLGRRETLLLSLLPLLGVYGYFIDPLWSDIIAFLGVVLTFRLFKVISKQEADFVSSLLPSGLGFLRIIVRMISS